MQVLLGKPHGPEVDWWALGVMLFELTVGYSPFAADQIDDVFVNILMAELPWPEEDFLPISPEARAEGGCWSSAPPPF